MIAGAANVAQVKLWPGALPTTAAAGDRVWTLCTGAYGANLTALATPSMTMVVNCTYIQSHLLLADVDLADLVQRLIHAVLESDTAMVDTVVDMLLQRSNQIIEVSNRISVCCKSSSAGKCHRARYL